MIEITVHHEISRGRRGRSRRILPSRPDCLNGISKICWKIDSRANVRTDTQPRRHGSEPSPRFRRDRSRRDPCPTVRPRCFGVRPGFSGSEIAEQLRGVDLACFGPTRQPSGEFCGQTSKVGLLAGSLNQGAGQDQGSRGIGSSSDSLMEGNDSNPRWESDLRKTAAFRASPSAQ